MTMATLNERIMADLKRAMLDKDELSRDTLRMVKSDLGRREGELGRPLEEAEALDVLQKAVKAREDSVTQYAEGGREDLADRERHEIAIIRAYLPEPMDEAEAREAVQGVIDELGASSKKDLGRVMKTVLERHRGRIDGKVASRLAGELLG
jgi:uncharacterized protein